MYIFLSLLYGKGDFGKMKVLHVCPHTFGIHGSNFGGGERYPIELAKAMSKYVNVSLLAFGNISKQEQIGNLHIHMLHRSRFSTQKNPWRLALAKYIADADIVHCHQYRYILTNIVVALSKAMGKKVVLTDHGGGALDISRVWNYTSLFDGFAPVSRFSARDLGLSGRPTKVLFGGAPIPKVVQPSHRERILFVGRILPHKGVDVLIKAAGSDIPVDIVGTPRNKEYFSDLVQMARNTKVKFHTNVTDERLQTFYQSALALVLPSVNKDIYGKVHKRPELLGLTLIEAMMNGVPVVASNVGGIPEVIDNTVNGMIS